jgi:hypothetical protein
VAAASASTGARISTAIFFMMDSSSNVIGLPWWGLPWWSLPWRGHPGRGHLCRPFRSTVWIERRAIYFGIIRC